VLDQLERQKSDLPLAEVMLNASGEL